MSMKQDGMKKVILISAGAICVTLLVVSGVLWNALHSKQEYSAPVSGVGKVAFEPDIATITLGVQVDRVKKATDALNKINTQIHDIIVAVKAIGVTDADISTQNYSLYPQYDYNNGVQTTAGYTANEQIVIRVRGVKDNPELVSSVIEKSSIAGANQVQNVEYSVSNIEDLKLRARTLAIQNAKINAQKIAAATGAHLTEIVGWNDSQINIPTVYSGYGVGGGGGPIPSGVKEITAEIILNYEVKN